jgi:hypothetical protein
VNYAGGGVSNLMAMTSGTGAAGTDMAGHGIRKRRRFLTSLDTSIVPTPTVLQSATTRTVSAMNGGVVHRYLRGPSGAAAANLGNASV